MGGTTVLLGRGDWQEGGGSSIGGGRMSTGGVAQQRMTTAGGMAQQMPQQMTPDSLRHMGREASDAAGLAADLVAAKASMKREKSHLMASLSASRRTSQL